MARYLFPVLLGLIYQTKLLANSKIEDAIILNQELDFLVDSVNKLEISSPSDKKQESFTKDDDRAFELEKIYFEDRPVSKKKRF